MPWRWSGGKAYQSNIKAYQHHQFSPCFANHALPLSLSSPAQAQVSQPWTSQWIGTKWKRQDQCRHCLTEVYRILLVWKDNLESVKKQFVHLSPETPCTFLRLTTPYAIKVCAWRVNQNSCLRPQGKHPDQEFALDMQFDPTPRLEIPGASEYAALNSKSQGELLVIEAHLYRNPIWKVLKHNETNPWRTWTNPPGHAKNIEKHLPTVPPATAPPGRYDPICG